MCTPFAKCNSSSMLSIFHTANKRYELSVEKYTCSKFGLAEILAQNFEHLPLPVCSTALDVGSGVGPISLFLANECGQKVTAVEINPRAHQCCVKNISKYNAQDKITAYNIDFSQALSLLPRTSFDLIVANPPINFSTSKSIALPVANYNMKQKMDSNLFAFVTNAWRDEYGFDLVDHIFKFAEERLSKNGHIILVGCDIDQDCGSFIRNKKETYGYCEVATIPCSISPKSIGAENFLHTPIVSHIFLLTKKK